MLTPSKGTLVLYFSRLASVCHAVWLRDNSLGEKVALSDHGSRSAALWKRRPRSPGGASTTRGDALFR